MCVCVCVSVLQEAVSTGDPELVQLVLQYRDFKRATERLAGIPELLSKLRQVKHRSQLDVWWKTLSLHAPDVQPRLKALTNMCGKFLKLDWIGMHKLLLVGVYRAAEDLHKEIRGVRL